MALKEPFMIKCVLGNEDLELEADPGESFLVKDIQIYNPATNYVTITVAKATVGYFRVGGPLGSHLPFLLAQGKHSHDILLDPTGISVAETVKMKNAGGVAGDPSMPLAAAISSATTYKRPLQLEQSLKPQRTLLGYLWDKGIFKGYPVPTGEKLIITGAKQTGAVQLVIYEIHDEGDMKAEMPNGPAATEYFFINYGNSGANIAKTGDTILNNSVSPAEFPDFPYGKDVPAKTEITLHGILASDFACNDNDGTNYCYTKYLKLIRERVTLFDEDKNGLLLYAPFTTAYGDMDMVGEGQSVIGNYSDVDMRPPLMFPTPLVFTPGEELGVYLTTVGGGTPKNIGTDDQEVGLILTVKRL